MEQLDLLRHIVVLLEQLQIPYMIVGSFASSAYGEPRFTHDIDIVIDASPEQIASLIDHLPPDEFYASREAALSAKSSGGQFNVIHPQSGNKIDFMIARRDPWGTEQLRRRMRIEILQGLEAYAARPEDIIVSKMIYYAEGGSEKHLRDITGILTTSANDVDRAYVARWAGQLQLTEIWAAILRRLGEQ